MTENQKSIVLLGGAFVALLFGWPALLKGIGVYRWECIPDVFLGEYFTNAWLTVLSWIFHTAWLCGISGQGVARNWLPALMLNLLIVLPGGTVLPLILVFTMFTFSFAPTFVVFILEFFILAMGLRWLLKSRFFSHINGSATGAWQASVVVLAFIPMLVMVFFMIGCATWP
ncbi:MAG: hypothetical protein IIC54_11380 [Proteobacteria bacterium]|nr:hypothetical protein [Pseudomonadota bacterium]